MLVLSPERGWAKAFVVEIFALLVGRILIDNLWPAIGRRTLVLIDAAGPVDLRIVLLGNQQFAGAAIERVAKSIAIEMRQQLARLAVHLLIGEDHLVDAVIVPLVVRCHLIDPARHAGVR